MTAVHLTMLPRCISLLAPVVILLTAAIGDALAQTPPASERGVQPSAQPAASTSESRVT